MSKQLFVVYETDAWHSISNRDCKGIYTSKTAAIRDITKHHKIELDEIFDLSDEDLTPSAKKRLEKEARPKLPKELEICYQTQGYSINYDIEIWLANDWG